MIDSDVQRVAARMDADYEELHGDCLSTIRQLREEVAALKRGLDEDTLRWSWLQRTYGEKPWKLTNWIPGTNDVRKAIDHAIQIERTQATVSEEPKAAETQPPAGHCGFWPKSNATNTCKVCGLPFDQHAAGLKAGEIDATVVQNENLQFELPESSNRARTLGL